MDTPYKIDRKPNQLHYTYLDTFGRPVLVASKSNLVEHHIQDVMVRRTVGNDGNCAFYIVCIFTIYRQICRTLL